MAVCVHRQSNLAKWGADKALGLTPPWVTITAGKETIFKDDMFYVPKQMLVGALVAAVENDRLQIASELRYAPVLVGEFQAFRKTGRRRRPGRLRGGDGRGGEAKK